MIGPLRDKKGNINDIIEFAGQYEEKHEDRITKKNSQRNLTIFNIEYGIILISRQLNNREFQVGVLKEERRVYEKL